MDKKNIIERIENLFSLMRKKHEKKVILMPIIKKKSLIYHGTTKEIKIDFLLIVFVLEPTPKIKFVYKHNHNFFKLPFYTVPQKEYVAEFLETNGLLDAISEDVFCKISSTL